MRRHLEAELDEATERTYGGLTCDDVRELAGSFVLRCIGAGRGGGRA
jgi:hypothetical protein